MLKYKEMIYSNALTKVGFLLVISDANKNPYKLYDCFLQSLNWLNKKNLATG